MKIGTRSILFGVHQFIIHPFFVFIAWLILYKSFPRFYQLAAIITHDLGYFGQPNMDGVEGEMHPGIMANWWESKFGGFGHKVSMEIEGHSKAFCVYANLPLSKLYRADKLGTALYPKLLYLILGNLSGEIREYMEFDIKEFNNRKRVKHTNQLHWLIEVQAVLSLRALRKRVPE